MTSSDTTSDLFIIGGGINGCAIARDAAGRGLSVALAEMGDIGGATSSASTKLIHGGLRYLEYREFRLVREALAEREVLLAAMPHIAWPLRFVLPHHRGLRPAWLLRLGLFLYDHIGGRRLLPATRSLDLRRDPAGRALKPAYTRGFEYSDVWVEDARLVALTARDAAGRGAAILPRSRVTHACRAGDLWQIELATPAGPQTRHARALVNAAGPWVDEVSRDALGLTGRDRVRLVRGSHIVIPRLAGHDRAYLFQGADGRIVFALPFDDDFTLIGTTEVPQDGPPGTATCTPAEVAYLCRFASEYLARAITPADVVWTFSGIRPLFDDGAASATAASRDYVLRLEAGHGGGGGAHLLTVFGGKITTHRRLAEAALERLRPALPGMGPRWTAGAPLPGGDFAVGEGPRLEAALIAAHPFLTPAWARRLVRAYGTEAATLLRGAQDARDLGRDFGATLSAREVEWLMDREFAGSAEDVLWRRSKLGLRLTAPEAAALEAWMQARTQRRGRGATGVV